MNAGYLSLRNGEPFPGPVNLFTRVYPISPPQRPGQPPNAPAIVYGRSIGFPEGKEDALARAPGPLCQSRGLIVMQHGGCQDVFDRHHRRHDPRDEGR